MESDRLPRAVPARTVLHEYLPSISAVHDGVYEALLVNFARFGVYIQRRHRLALYLTLSSDVVSPVLNMSSRQDHRSNTVNQHLVRCVYTELCTLCGHQPTTGSTEGEGVCACGLSSSITKLMRVLFSPAALGAIRTIIVQMYCGARSHAAILLLPSNCYHPSISVPNASLRPSHNCYKEVRPPPTEVAEENNTHNSVSSAMNLHCISSAPSCR